MKSWVVAGSCFWINLFVFALFRSSGVLYIVLLREFNCSPSQASWPITLAGAVASLVCLPAGFLYHYLTIRAIVTCGSFIVFISTCSCYYVSSIIPTILLLGVFQGIGIGMVTGLLPVIINEYFTKNVRVGVVGLSYSGAAVGSFFFPLLFESLTDHFKLQQSLLVMGCIMFLSVIGAIPLKPYKKRHQENQQNPFIHPVVPATSITQRFKEDLTILHNPYFTRITLVYCAFTFSNVTFLMILPHYAVEVGLSRHEGVFLLSLYSITDLLGRLFPLIFNFSIKSTSKCHRIMSTQFMFLSSIFLLSCTFLFFPLLTSLKIHTIVSLSHIFLLLTLLTGFCSGLQMILAPVMFSDLLGSDKTAISFGLSNFICGLISLSRPFVIETVVLATSGYSVLFYGASALCILSSCAWVGCRK